MNRAKFELMAEKYNLDLNRNEHNYLNYQTQMAYEFACADDAEHLQMAHTIADAACCLDEMRMLSVHGQPPIEIRTNAVNHAERLHDVAENLAGERVVEGLRFCSPLERRARPLL